MMELLKPTPEDEARRFCLLAGWHHNGDTSAMLGNGGIVQLPEVMVAFYRQLIAENTHLRELLEESFKYQACKPVVVTPEIVEKDSAILQVIDQRDHWEQVIGDLAVLAGCKEEWSNLHEHGDCIAEEIHRLRAGSNYVANDEIYPTEVAFSNGRIVRIKNEDGKTFLGIGLGARPTPEEGQGEL